MVPLLMAVFEELAELEMYRIEMCNFLGQDRLNDRPVVRYFSIIRVLIDRRAVQIRDPFVMRTRRKVVWQKSMAVEA